MALAESYGEDEKEKEEVSSTLLPSPSPRLTDLLLLLPTLTTVVNLVWADEDPTLSEREDANRVSLKVEIAEKRRVGGVRTVRVEGGEGGNAREEVLRRRDVGWKA